MSKEWFIKDGGQVCFNSDNAELNGWDTQSLVNCLNSKEIKIADLQSQLADKDKEIKELKFELEDTNRISREAHKELWKQYNKVIEENEQAHMLNDSADERIKDLQCQIEEKSKEIEELNTQIEQVTRKLPASYKKEQNQKAIEQLEKVKAELVKLGQDYRLNLCGIKIYNFVDDQINELKGNVEYE